MKPWQSRTATLSLFHAATIPVAHLTASKCIISTLWLGRCANGASFPRRRASGSWSVTPSDQKSTQSKDRPLPVLRGVPELGGGANFGLNVGAISRGQFDPRIKDWWTAMQCYKQPPGRCCAPARVCAMNWQGSNARFVTLRKTTRYAGC